MRIIQDFHTPENIAARDAARQTIITAPQPTWGESTFHLPILDFSVSTLPRAMTRREWRQMGFGVKPRQQPVRKEARAEARFFAGRWHGGEIGLFTKKQTTSIAELEARRESKQKQKREWSKITVLNKLTTKARCLYVHLLEKARALEAIFVVTNNGELKSACSVHQKDIKRVREELQNHGLIQHKLIAGRQSKIIINQLALEAAEASERG